MNLLAIIEMYIHLMINTFLMVIRITFLYNKMKTLISLFKALLRPLSSTNEQISMTMAMTMSFYVTYFLILISVFVMKLFTCSAVAKALALLSPEGCWHSCS